MIPAGRGKLRVIGTANKKAQLWREAVQNAISEAMVRVGWVGGPKDAYELVTVFRLGKNPGVTIKLTKIPNEGEAIEKPDLDNLIKLVMDAMQNAGAFGMGNDPDAQVTSVTAKKLKARELVSERELVLDGLSGLS